MALASKHYIPRKQHDDMVRGLRAIAHLVCLELRDRRKEGEWTERQRLMAEHVGFEHWDKAYPEGET